LWRVGRECIVGHGKGSRRVATGARAAGFPHAPHADKLVASHIHFLELPVADTDRAQFAAAVRHDKPTIDETHLGSINVSIR
jgi:hypothetical protein